MKLRWRVAQFLERRWWKSYLSKKNPKDYHEWKTSYWIKFLEDLKFDKPDGLRILDAGCGPAGIFIILQGNDVHAVDPLIDSYAGFDHFKMNDYPWVTFHPFPFEEYSSSPFDIVFCINAINHFNDLTAGYKNLFAHIKPTGRLIVSTDCHRYSFFKYLFRLLRFDALHPHQNDQGEHEQIITQLGGKIENCAVSRHDFFFNYVVFDIRITDQ